VVTIGEVVMEGTGREGGTKETACGCIDGFCCEVTEGATACSKEVTLDIDGWLDLEGDEEVTTVDDFVPEESATVTLVVVLLAVTVT